MNLIRIYLRTLGLLAPAAQLAWTLAIAKSPAGRRPVRRAGAVRTRHRHAVAGPGECERLQLVHADALKSKAASRLVSVHPARTDLLRPQRKVCAKKL